MKTVSKILMGAATFFFVGTAAAQTEYDQDKKHKDKDKHKDKSTSQMYEGQQKEQDFSSYDLNQDGQISEDEFAIAYAQNNTTDSSDQYERTGQQEGVTGAEQEGVTGTEQEGVTEQEQEGVAGQTQTGETDEYVAEIFETIDEDDSGYVDQEEFQSWTGGQGK